MHHIIGEEKINKINPNSLEVVMDILKKRIDRRGFLFLRVFFRPLGHCAKGPEGRALVWNPGGSVLGSSGVPDYKVFNRNQFGMFM